jgi:hypothetical protein
LNQIEKRLTDIERKQPEFINEDGLLQRLNAVMTQYTNS